MKKWVSVRLDSVFVDSAQEKENESFVASEQATRGAQGKERYGEKRFR